MLTLMAKMYMRTSRAHVNYSVISARARLRMGGRHVVRGRSGFYNRLWLLVTVVAICGAGVHLYHLTTSYLE